MYAAYVLFLVPFIAVGAPWLAVLVQAMLAVVAAHALARIADRIGGPLGSGDAAFALALMCYPFQQWVLALYTESFFASLAVLFLERITRPGPVQRMVWALAALLLFARPVGLLFVFPAFIWKFAALRKLGLPGWSLNCAYAVVLLLALCVPAVGKDKLAAIVEAHVICGFPEKPGAMEHFDGNSVMSAQKHLFAMNGPRYAAGLFVRRALSVFTLGRAYYSAQHNVLLLPFYLLFALAAIGAWHSRVQRIVGLLLALLVLNTAIIGFTHDEWSGRFLVPLWPPILVFAGLGASWLMVRVRRV